MGCQCLQSGKTADSTGEQSVSMYESYLGFPAQPVEFVIQVLNDCTVKGGLTTQLLREWLTQAKLQTTLLDISGSPINFFYEKLREKKRFSVKTLTVLSVLLSEGMIRKKAEILYNACDKTRTESIQVEEVKELVQIACDVALLYVPQYAEMETIALRNAEGMRKLQKYLEKLRRAYQLTIEEMQSLIAVDKKRLTSDEFVEVVTSKVPQLAEAHSIRALALTLLSKRSESQAQPTQAFTPQHPSLLRSKTQGPTFRSFNRRSTMSATVKPKGNGSESQSVTEARAE